MMEDEQDTLLNGACDEKSDDFFILDGIQQFNNDEMQEDPLSKETPVESIKSFGDEPAPAESLKSVKDKVIAMDGLSNNFSGPTCLLRPENGNPPPKQEKKSSLWQTLQDIKQGKGSKYLLPKSTETNPRENSNAVQDRSDVGLLSSLKNVRRTSSSVREYNGYNRNTGMKSISFRETSLGNKTGQKVMEIATPPKIQKPVVLKLEDVLKASELKKMMAASAEKNSKIDSNSKDSPASQIRSLRQYRINNSTPTNSQVTAVSLGTPKTLTNSYIPVTSSLSMSRSTISTSSSLWKSPSDRPLSSSVTQPSAFVPVSRNNRGKSNSDYITTGKLSPNKTSVLFIPIPVSKSETDTTTTTQNVDKDPSHVPKAIRDSGGFTPKNNILPPSPLTTQDQDDPDEPDEMLEDAAPATPFSQISKSPVPLSQKDSPIGFPIVKSKHTESITSSAQNSKKEEIIPEKADPDIAVVRESHAREAKKDVVTHTIEDGSDSDLCIVKEDIKAPVKKKIRMKKRTSLKCSECDFKTSTISQLQIHEKAHPKGRKIKCSKCPFETRIKSCMIYHAAMHSGRKQFRCSKCKFETDILDKFISHEKQELSCLHCKMTFHLVKELQNHIVEKHKMSPNSHLNSQEQVPNSVYKGKKRGRKPKKKEEESFKCRYCSFQTSSQSGLLSHMSMKHRNVQYNSKQGEYECEQCGYVTDEQLFLVRHMRVHSKTKIGTLSPEKQLYKCSFCDFETEFDEMMQNHLITHTESDSDFDMDNDVAATTTFAPLVPEEKYQCNNCSFKSNNQKLFEKHKSSHIRRNVFSIVMNSLFES